MSFTINELFRPTDYEKLFYDGSKLHRSSACIRVGLGLIHKCEGLCFGVLLVLMWLLTH